jgi:hypothetical protein
MTVTLPVITVQCQFTPGVLTDISAYVRGFTITRPSTRVQGPLLAYQAGTLSLTLDNSDGRFDPDNLAGPYVSVNPSYVSTLTGSGTWIPPAGIAATSKPELTGGGGGGGGAGGLTGEGGGGGEYARDPAYAVAAGAGIAYSRGPAGRGLAGGATTDGGDTTFGTLTAHGGKGGTGFGSTGQGGTGSTAPVHHDGGAGGNVSGSYGGGGGSSGGSSAAGNNGSAASPPSPAPGGAAVAGGGPGGNGATPAQDATTPPGPGGGGGAGNGTFRGNDSAAGQILLTWSLAGTYTNILPMVPVTVTATWNSVTYPLYSGYADGWQESAVDYEGGYSEWTLTATDGFKILAGQNLAAITPAGTGEDSGARVTRILDAAGWPAGQRLVDTGDSPVQATAYGSDVLSLLQLTADTEIGELYVDGAGNVVFRHRRGVLEDTRSAIPQGVLGDLPGTAHAAGTELPYASVGRADDDTTLASDVQVTRAGSSAVQEVTDPLAYARYRFPRTYSRTDVLLQSDGEALSYAQAVLYVSKSDENRFDSVTVDPQADASVAGLWPQVLGREIGDRVQAWKRPPNVAAISKDLLVRGITHTFDAVASTWSTTWVTQSAAKYSGFFIFGDPVLGVLDGPGLSF